jgi:hypothetical protein
MSDPGKKVPKIGGSRNPGNFPIFITPKKFTSFYSKDFLPKLIFLRKGVHHPKSGFPGVVAEIFHKFFFSRVYPKILNCRNPENSGFCCQAQRLDRAVHGLEGGQRIGALRASKTERTDDCPALVPIRN